jgi:cobalamin biosynthesis Mg chelatase CobN
MVFNLTNLNQDVLDIIKSMDLKALEKEIQNDYENCIDEMDNSYHYADKHFARQKNSVILARCKNIREKKLKSMKSRKAQLKFLLKQRSPDRSFTKTKKASPSPRQPPPTKKNSSSPTSSSRKASSTFKTKKASPSPGQSPKTKKKSSDNQEKRETLASAAEKRQNKSSSPTSSSIKRKASPSHSNTKKASPNSRQIRETLARAAEKRQKK